MSDPSINLSERHLERVLEITRTMAAATDLEEVLARVVDCSMDLLDAERASVFLYDPERNELVTRVAAGVEQIRIPADKGVAGATIQLGQTIVVSDAYADTRFNPDVDRRTGFRTRNILSLPLRGHRGDLVGVLQIVNRRTGSFDTGDVSLAEAFGAQAGVAIQRANLIAHFQEKQAMERDMAMAREIQQGLLPRSAPDAPGFDIAGFTRPADATGGDAFDFMRLPDGKWMLLLADATGHGIGPALVMTETRAMLRVVSLHCSAEVSQVLSAVNNLLKEDLDDSRFVTCFYGLLDPQTGELAYGSAGHGPILHYSTRRKTVETLKASGPPLGVVDDIPYDRKARLLFEPGDWLLVTSDGITEACDPAGAMYDGPRLSRFLANHHHLAASAFIEALVADVDAHRGTGAQADDVTVMAIRKL